jgi:hydrogenase maturation protein HypF
MNSSKINTTRLDVSGLIQGVGFRPFAYKLATALKLKGKVYNQNNRVIVLLKGEKEFIKIFMIQLSN